MSKNSNHRPQRQKPRGGKTWKNHGESFNEYKNSRRRRSEMEQELGDSNIVDANYWNDKIDDGRETF